MVRCSAIECTTEIDSQYLMCAACWAKVPKGCRDAVDGSMNKEELHATQVMAIASIYRFVNKTARELWLGHALNIRRK